MSLLLSSADILRLNEAAHILLSPFAFENGTAWRREAGRVIAPLVNASHAFSGMTVEGEEFWSGDEQDVRGLSSLPIPDFVYRGAVQRRVDLRLDVADWTELYDINEARASQFYEEVVRPFELFAPLAIYTELPGLPPSAFWSPPPDARRDWSLMSLFFCFPDEEAAFQSLERNRAVLRLLAPSLSAGARAYVHAQRYGASFSNLVDRISQAAAILDMSGRLIYRNHAMSVLLQQDPEHHEIASAIEGAARVLGSLRPRMCAKAGPDHLIDCQTREVRTKSKHYSIHVAFVEGTVHGLKDSILALVEPSASTRPSYAALGSRYGLTPRETTVLQLVCAGMTTRKLATALNISWNTARRHVEHVLSKLGVHSRSEAVAKVMASRSME